MISVYFTGGTQITEHEWLPLYTSKPVKLISFEHSYPWQWC
jgi:hypothetical protein